MSQRLLVSLKSNVTESDSFYDCIYTEDSKFENLLHEWGAYNDRTGFYSGPWQANIRNEELFDQFMEDFVKLKKYIPELTCLQDCWVIYMNGESFHNQNLDEKFRKVINTALNEPGETE